MHSFRSHGVSASPHVVYRPRFERFEGSGTFADVDRVAFEVIVQRRPLGSCGAAYVSAVGGGVGVESKGLRYEIDDIVRVHDRRTGRAIATRTFEGNSPCDEPGREPRRVAALVAWLDWK